MNLVGSLRQPLPQRLRGQYRPSRDKIGAGLPRYRRWSRGRASMAFYKTERLALFIDGANLYSAGKTLGVEVDYRKLLDEFRRRGQLVRAYYYTALVENEDYSPIRPLVDWLQYNGFKVVTKPAKEFTDSTGR